MPQLPELDPREGLIAQWAGALPEVTVARDGSFTIDRDRVRPSRSRRRSTPATHAGLFAFLEAAERDVGAPPRMKMQVVGPLTLGVALEPPGSRRTIAFRTRR